MFKVGDKIECVDNMGRKHLIKLGKIYTVKSINNANLIQLEDINHEPYIFCKIDLY